MTSTRTLQFTPPRCPYPDCVAHAAPPAEFFQRCGTYLARCRNAQIPRFRCKSCRRTFSRQTFRSDYRDHKPWLNVRVAEHFVSGTGQRQTGRVLGIALTTVQRKLEKLGEHCRELCRTLTGSFRGDVVLSFDELETFETCRSTQPLTVPIAVRKRSGYMIASCAAPIPPSGRMTPRRRALIALARAASGRARPNRSRLACRIVLRFVASRLREARSVRIVTDQKRTYPGVLAQAFAGLSYEHETVSSKQVRDRRNPLFWSNLTNAMSRDNLGRLHRRSWLVSKRRRWLELHLSLFHAFRNFVRQRTNRDPRTPAMVERFVHRTMSWHEVLSWRQDHGPERSIHPLSAALVSPQEYRAELAGAAT